MMKTSSIRTRIGVLLSAIVLLALASIPLLGTAQDATPSGQETDMLAQGEQIFTNVCIACHQPGGVGIEGIYPPLNGNPLLTGDDPTYFISTVLTGRGGMPAFAGIYSDEEVASIVSYVRQAWDNDAGPVDPMQVAEIRNELFPPVEENPRTQAEETEGDATPEGGDASPEATPEATP
jgi:mono/diheme cytochrome c family protein